MQTLREQEFDSVFNPNATCLLNYKLNTSFINLCPSLAEIFHMPLPTSLIRILRLSCSKCPLWTDGVSRVQKKGWKTPKSEKETSPKLYPSFTNAEKVWIWKQRLQFELIGRRKSYVFHSMGHLHLLLSWSTFPYILSQQNCSRDTYSGKENTATSLACLVLH